MTGPPQGFSYRDDFLTLAEEASISEEIALVEFATFELRGVVARRRVAFYGRSYDSGDIQARPIAPFLFPVRDRLAAWAGVPPDAFAMALINEYRPGAPVGWHRDAPQYEMVAGVSLLSPCRMKFRPYASAVHRAGTQVQRRTATHQIVLQPRSAYLMTSASRSDFEHHVPPVAALRYSITFRTLR